MNYSSNSHKSRSQEKEVTPERKIEKIITGNVTKEKKGDIRKAAEAFLPPDGVDGIKSHILMDVIVPTIKQIVDDTVHTILYGTTAPVRDKIGGGSRRYTNRASYDRYYDKKEERKYEKPAKIGYDNVVLESRGEGLAVVDAMKRIIYESECVSVADLYSLVGITEEYTDHDYGWLDLTRAEVVLLRNGGYALRLPRPIMLPAAQN